MCQTTFNPHTEVFLKKRTTDQKMLWCVVLEAMDKQEAQKSSIAQFSPKVLLYGKWTFEFASIHLHLPFSSTLENTITWMTENLHWPYYTPDIQYIPECTNYQQWVSVYINIDIHKPKIQQHSEKRFCKMNVKQQNNAQEYTLTLFIQWQYSNPMCYILHMCCTNIQPFIYLFPDSLHQNIPHISH